MTMWGRAVVLAWVAGCSYQGRDIHDAPSAADARRFDDGAQAADAPVDAMVDPPDAAVCDVTNCDGIGGTCQSGACVLPGDGDLVVCPTGIPCVVECDVDNRCDTIDCGGATSCEARCIQDHTCGAVICPVLGPCTLYCEGNHACQDLDIPCPPLQTCEYTCCGTGQCGTITCSGAGSCTGGPGACP